MQHRPPHSYCVAMHIVDTISLRLTLWPVMDLDDRASDLASNDVLFTKLEDMIASHGPKLVDLWYRLAQEIENVLYTTSWDM